MFKNVFILKNLLNSSTKFTWQSIPSTILPEKDLCQSYYNFHTISSEYPQHKLLNSKLPLAFNDRIINNGTTIIQSINNFSKTPKLNRKRKRIRGSDRNLKYDTRIPKLVYLHNPIKYLKTKLKFWKLKLRWDRRFSQKEFVRGTKQAAVVLTDVVRTQNFESLGKFTTRVGFHQITRDMILSKSDPRLQMIQLRGSDLRRAIPVKVMLYEHQGFRHCLIDMFFVGMRNVNDFKSNAAHAQMSDLIKKFEIITNKNKHSPNINQDQQLNRIIFAEIFVRFYRDYTDPKFLDNWNVSFYKVLNFDILQIRDRKK